jgi:hypothetical protein
MANLTFREQKGSALTIEELDNNFAYFTGSHAITGSLNLTGNVTASVFVGTLQGTASYALTSSVTIATTATTASSLIDGVKFLGKISSSLLPAGPYTNNTSSYDLGSSTAAWKDLYLSNGTIYLLSQNGNASIAYNDSTNTFTFTNSDGLPTSLYDGGISAGAALNYTGSDYGVSLYFTGSNFRKTNLCIITGSTPLAVNISIPTAGNYSPGTVVEFDIIASISSSWKIVTVNDSGAPQTGFIAAYTPIAALPVNANDYQDFNPFWNPALVGPEFSNQNSEFPLIFGAPGGYASGSALIRLVALRQAASQNNTTIYSGSTHWFGRVISRDFYATGSL